MQTEREIIVEDSPILEKVEKRLLADKVSVNFEFHSPGLIIIGIFREQIRSAIIETAGSVSRSNWTYQIAFAMMTAAKTTNHIIRFESEGKRDAIIEDQPDEKGHSEAVLAAEWEWDSADIFGPGKEIEKLFKTLQKHPACHGLLYTYVLESDFPEFVAAVHKEWQALTSSRKGAADLPLNICIVTYTGTNSTRVFKAIQTISLQGNEVIIWEELRLFNPE